MKRDRRAGKGKHAERRWRKGSDRQAGRGRVRAGGAAVALCSPLLAGPLPGTGSGAAATSVRTQRRKRPPLLPLPGNLLLWVH